MLRVGSPVAKGLPESMANENNGAATPESDADARLVTSPEDKAKATKWFLRARELGEKRQFDYAIEYYVNGLEFWPDAVEEALKSLHGCAVARRQTGGKKPGFKDTMKRSLNDKDSKKALSNALWLFGRDPDNLNHLEALARNAGRHRAEDAAKWAAAVYQKALESTAKVSAKQLQALIQMLEELGDRAAARGESEFGVEVYTMGVEVLNLWRRRFPKDEKAEGLVKNLSTKLTILKGRYKDGDSYRESIVDSEEQTDLHDEQRSVQSDERLEELIAKAETEYNADRDSRTKLKSFIDLLCRRERDEDEIRAIGVLVAEYKRTDDYGQKQWADDIRMKQLGRQARLAAKSGDREEAKAQRIAQLRFELGVYRERIERYPTDNRVRYEYAVRNFDAGRFDEAIPLFQASRSDPKNKAACGMYLGRCFFRKGYHGQAVSAIQSALDDHKFSDDDLAKEMQYWLARAYQGLGDPTAARATFGKILQLDYNYRDVRARMDALPAAE